MPKRKKKQIQTTEFYAIEILDWELDYGINLSPTRHKFDLDPETYSLVCYGKMMFPEKIAGCTLEARFRTTRYMTKVLNDNTIDQKEANTVGSLQVWGKSGNYFIAYVHHDVMSSILIALIAKKINYIFMQGDVLKKGYATIEQFNFERDLSDLDE